MKETNRLEGDDEEQLAGDEEATKNRTDLKWIHGNDDEFGDDDCGDDFSDEEVWHRLRAFIYWTFRYFFPTYANKLLFLGLQYRFLENFQ